MNQYLALELASTIRHDGHGGVIDDLADTQGLTTWLRDQADLLADWNDTDSITVGEAARSEVVAVRAAVRALFARAVRPGPPSPADASRLLPVDQALARINTATARQPVTPMLDWPEDGAPKSILRSTEPDPVIRLTATLARSAIDFLTGPQRTLLRACTAPRCVRYFVKEHGRQEWCKASCGNRARAARHYQRHRPPTEPGPRP
ncbi:CGNR zinc finger domain-containing protein [Micromonospora polyrhachis]|uniref:Putative RNA-binding Zn ribbon-like protein n=1 Tax=Micromonospora polyrhachis TaxID=1282883 RepID=A0A7W7WQ21_9ACTN|nr:ABATE domain-containing protein [Micromonospora polyrhachis]MBB4959570.1 putative RNA-binding Zn ribbon-like protein [Micromonospora polyrhachis]